MRAVAFSLTLMNRLFCIVLFVLMLYIPDNNFSAAVLAEHLKVWILFSPDLDTKYLQRLSASHLVGKELDVKIQQTSSFHI